MIEKNVDLTPGTVIKQDEEGGLRYEIKGPVLNATGWEKTHAIAGELISYVQLEDGKFQAGTVWGREEEDLRSNFSVEETPQT